MPRTLSLESIARGGCQPTPVPWPGIELREFVSGRCGASGVSTGTVTLEPGAELPWHVCPVSEALTVISGEVEIAVEGRRYLLGLLDSLHVPGGAVRGLRNPSANPALLHWAQATGTPARDPAPAPSTEAERGAGGPQPGDPETIRRFLEIEPYELSPGAYFRDLFAARFGSKGICGGYGLFQPGSSLPCHIHDYDESITIVSGAAICLVQGSRYDVSGCDTAFVPRGRPHRFLNESKAEMAMIWVYAGDEPEREIVDAGYCSGKLVWPQSHAS